MQFIWYKRKKHKFSQRIFIYKYLIFLPKGFENAYNKVLTHGKCRKVLKYGVPPFWHSGARRKIYLVEQARNPVIWTTFHLLRHPDTHQWSCKTKISSRRKCIAIHCWQQQIHNLWGYSTVNIPTQKSGTQWWMLDSKLCNKAAQGLLDLRIQNTTTLQLKTRWGNTPRLIDWGL